MNTQPGAAPEKEKKEAKPEFGVLMIIAGLAGIASRFFGDVSWNAIYIVKLCFSVAVLGFGVWTLIKSKKSK